ncbi:MAG TPA: hypothetical protein P5044_10750, partial [bacterium]|nr:hypothetical protein [bacterium]
MKKSLFLIIAMMLLACESPHKFDFDKYLNGNDDDAGNTTGDSDNGDTGDTGNTGNTGSDPDSVVITDGDAFIDTDQIDIDQSDMDEFNDADSDADTDNDTDTDIDTDIVVELFCGDGKVSNGEICDGNTVSCSSLGIGTDGTAVCGNDCKSWITAWNCTKTTNCSSKPEAGTIWNDGGKNGTYTQTW